MAFERGVASNTFNASTLAHGTRQREVVPAVVYFSASPLEVTLPTAFQKQTAFECTPAHGLP
jgi:hypothetical protein